MNKLWEQQVKKSDKYFVLSLQLQCIFHVITALDFICNKMKMDVDLIKKSEQNENRAACNWVDETQNTHTRKRQYLTIQHSRNSAWTLQR